jgi:two-component system invasion response regulator UvrY
MRASVYAVINPRMSNTTKATQFKKVLLVDDHEIVRFGISQMLQQRWPHILVRQASSLFDAMQVIEALEPDLVISDLKFTGIPVADSISRIWSIARSYPVVVFSMFPADVAAVHLRHPNVLVTICKAEGMERLNGVLSEVYEGSWQKATPEADYGKYASVARLSSRERDVALAIASGKSNHMICEDLGLKPSTVSTYKTRVFEKLSINNEADLIRMIEFIPSDNGDN